MAILTVKASHEEQQYINFLWTKRRNKFHVTNVLQDQQYTFQGRSGVRGVSRMPRSGLLLV